MTAQHNIVVIGGGAGLRAIAIAETNPHLDVAIVKAYRCAATPSSVEQAVGGIGDDDSPMNTRTTRYPVATGCVTKMRLRLFVAEASKSW